MKYVLCCTYKLQYSSVHHPSAQETDSAMLQAPQVSRGHSQPAGMGGQQSSALFAMTNQAGPLCESVLHADPLCTHRESMLPPASAQLQAVQPTFIQGSSKSHQMQAMVQTVRALVQLSASKGDDNLKPVATLMAGKSCFSLAFIRNEAGCYGHISALHVVHPLEPNLNHSHMHRW